jgi:hypothetical protein
MAITYLRSVFVFFQENSKIHNLKYEVIRTKLHQLQHSYLYLAEVMGITQLGEMEAVGRNCAKTKFKQF